MLGAKIESFMLSIIHTYYVAIKASMLTIVMLDAKIESFMLSVVHTYVAIKDSILSVVMLSVVVSQHWHLVSSHPYPVLYVSEGLQRASLLTSMRNLRTKEVLQKWAVLAYA